MILDEKEVFKLKINKLKIAANLLIVIVLSYRFPMQIYKRWQLQELYWVTAFYCVFAALMLFVAIRQLVLLLSKNLVVELSDLGVTTQQFGFMRWDLIRDINVDKNTMLHIYLKQPDVFLADLKVSNFRQKLMDNFDKDNGTPFVIQIGETNFKRAEFDAALAKFRKIDPSV